MYHNLYINEQYVWGYSSVTEHLTADEQVTSFTVVSAYELFLFQNTCTKFYIFMYHKFFMNEQYVWGYSSVAEHLTADQIWLPHE
jgi:hypothetical protein